MSLASPTPRARYAWSATLILLFALVTALVLPEDGPLRVLDWQVHEWVEEQRIPERAGWLVAVARLGQRWLVASLVGVVLAVTVWRQRSLRPVWLAASGFVPLWLVVGAIKAVTDRTAPAAGVDLFFSTGGSYPSGHTAGALVGWSLLALLLAGPPALRPDARRYAALRAVAGGATVAVGVAMVLMDFHWLSDCLAAWALALLVAQIPRTLADRWYGRPAVEAPAAAPAREAVSAPARV
ncbi:phosphatase PAP2 family protein [Allostreptomyces psammosilenae]|uniref:Undecaprenyl-diphosphatase n=1 Tax=Allostreptomyces psammosilenae TaxID=1892865 RepID=A0A853A152_9ACTN|nr:phosphatase PAP2 family protein [Allostreptomyces psammosilenae]NYI07180.1 undecaprenyl-diphosphatase [Allostreptomyces psammosilenae]